MEPLRKLGLTEGEVKVYLALISLGETTTGPLVNNSGVSISKVYTILDKLTKRGLASHIVKSKTKYFKAADPQQLLIYNKRKEADLKQQEIALKKLVPLLQDQQQSAITQETAQVFDGLKGIQTARERTLKIMRRDDLMWIIGIARTAYDRLTPYFADYHTNRCKKGIRCNYLYDDDARDPFGKKSATYPFSKVRYLPKGVITHSWIEVYADTVTIGMNKGKTFSVVIQNKEVADSFREYAKVLWSLSKE